MKVTVAFCARASEPLLVGRWWKEKCVATADSLFRFLYVAWKQRILTIIDPKLRDDHVGYSSKNFVELNSFKRFKIACSSLDHSERSDAVTAVEAHLLGTTILLTKLWLVVFCTCVFAHQINQAEKKKENPFLAIKAVVS